MKELHPTSHQLEAWKIDVLQSLKQLEGGKIIIVGDVGLDEYVHGQVERISQEAPVPVLDVEQQEFRIGLAANVAQNVSSLGGQAFLVSVVGDDKASLHLAELLGQQGVSADYLIKDPSRPTTHKVRVMSGQHHIVRIDYEKRLFISSEVQDEVLRRVEALLPEAHGLIIEDYAKGVLSEDLTQRLIAAAKKYEVKVMADPHPSSPCSFYRGVDLMTPNQSEALQLSGLHYDDRTENAQAVLEAGNALSRQLQCDHMIITRGKEGMSLFEKDGVTHLPTYARQVFDVTGAGDTVIAALALAWTSGMSLVQSCVLANHAAGVVVAKVGCVPCTAAELKAFMETHHF